MFMKEKFKQWYVNINTSHTQTVQGSHRHIDRLHYKLHSMWRIIWHLKIKSQMNVIAGIEQDILVFFFLIKHLIIATTETWSLHSNLTDECLISPEISEYWLIYCQTEKLAIEMSFSPEWIP